MSADSQPASKPPETHVGRLAAVLRVIATQVEAAARDTDAPTEALVEAAHTVGSASQTLARCVFDFSGQPVRVFQDLMVLHDHLQSRAGKAAAAVQFHDRLVQSLSHVTASLTYLAEFISSGPKSISDWDSLREQIRGVLSMEQERMLFDMANEGATRDQIREVIAQNQEVTSGVVELF